MREGKEEVIRRERESGDDEREKECENEWNAKKEIERTTRGKAAGKMRKSERREEENKGE